jgi:hypothetical protein
MAMHIVPDTNRVFCSDERVSSSLKQQIIKARTAKKLTQSQLAQVRIF